MKIKSRDGFAHILLIAAGVFLVGGAGTGLASNSARPGDLLYGMDRSMEGLRHAFTFGDEAEAKLHAEQAQERLGELKSLINGNAPSERLDQAARNYGDHLEEALVNANKIGNEEAKGEVLALVAEETLLDQDELLEQAESAGELVQASIQAAMQHANQGFEKSYGQLNEAVKAQVMERVQSKALNAERLMEQVQLKTQDNQPEDAGSDNKPEDAGSDSAGSENAPQGSDTNKPEDAGSGSSSGQGNN